MASIPMDIVEIRRTIYGKAMREPIADACLHLKDKNRRSVIKRLDNVEIRAVDAYDDNFYAESSDETDLEITSIEDDDYLLTDNRDNDSVVLIEESDYIYNLDDSLWTSVMAYEEEGNYRLILHY